MVRNLAHKCDPLDEVLTRTQLDDGLVLDKCVVPLGVFAVVFESRPDIFFQILGLALRTGNGVVLKAGREVRCSTTAMFMLAKKSFDALGFPSDWFLLVEGRQAVEELLRHDDVIDLVIPRGSNKLVQTVKSMTKIPVLGHAAGVCHLYVHSAARVETALRIIIDSKTQYPAACNAVETILVDSEISAGFLPLLKEELEKVGVVLRGCPLTCELIGLSDQVEDAEWSTEYGDLTLAVKIVPGFSQAVAHIQEYGSHHTDGILSQDDKVCEDFLRIVDSAGVYSNCSTRFADGYRYGFGAEIGIGTGKLHARGPVGMDGLLSYKYVLRGNGHIVSEYVGDSPRAFQWKTLKDPR
jgi:glutamate-5-semialdehyde dehydrogenase